VLPANPQNLFVSFDENTIRTFAQNSFPDGSKVYRDFWYFGLHLWVQMDFHEITLRQLIRPDWQLDSLNWYQIMYGIASRLRVVHSAGVFHGDLKPSNGTHCSRRILIKLVLLDYDSGSITWRNVHLSDFGITSMSQVVIPVLGVAKVLPGTLSYMPPEIRHHGQTYHTPASDIWALGCIGHEMCLGGRLSYGLNRAAIDSVVAGGPLELPPVDDTRYGYLIREIIRRCLVRDPQYRMTIDQLCQALESAAAEARVQFL
jgi:serine/threonine protein kinase